MALCKDYSPEVKPCKYYKKPSLCTLKNRYRCIEAIANGRVMLSYSSLSDYTMCKRKFLYSYILGIEPVTKPLTMALGSIFHAYMAALHTKSEQESQRYQSEALDLLDNIKSSYGTEDNIVQDIARIGVLVEMYQELGYDKIKGEVEKTFFLDHDGVLLRGKVDMIFRDEEKDMTGVYEFKYTQNPDNYTWFTTFVQTGIYFMLTDADYITYRAVRRPQTKLTKKEDYDEYCERIKKDVRSRPNYYFKEFTFWRFEYDFATMRRYIRAITKEIVNLVKEAGDDRDKMNELFYPQHNVSVCLTPYACKYVSICEARCEPENTEGFAVRKVKVTNEEETIDP